eukprot:9874099-Alexandrium_andersonii.AAC.1
MRQRARYSTGRARSGRWRDARGRKRPCKRFSHSATRHGDWSSSSVRGRRRACLLYTSDAADDM